MKLNYEELEARCAALAAENAGLKAFIATDCHVAHVEPETFYGEEVTRYVSADGYEPETPATDTFLGEVRAQGVEQLASLAGNKYQRYKSVNDRSGARKWKSIVILCTDFAAQLSKGVQS
ncbi:hypothetical protein ACNPM5_20730 [Enterobacter hormaechei]|uniref:hypothetical protein n=1 Tax=Enterobacter hormaechei TaxID=158836 RepID=UPI003AABE43A